MIKQTVLIFFLFAGMIVSAQTNADRYTRYIKITAADSLTELKATVKKQLAGLYTGAAGKTTNHRILLNSTDQSSVLPVARWMAAKQKQDIYTVRLSGLVSK